MCICIPKPRNMPMCGTFLDSSAPKVRTSYIGLNIDTFVTQISDCFSYARESSSPSMWMQTTKQVSHVICWGDFHATVHTWKCECTYICSFSFLCTFHSTNKATHKFMLDVSVAHWIFLMFLMQVCPYQHVMYIHVYVHESACKYKHAQCTQCLHVSGCVPQCRLRTLCSIMQFQASSIFMVLLHRNSAQQQCFCNKGAYMSVYLSSDPTSDNPWSAITLHAKSILHSPYAFEVLSNPR